MYEWSECKYCCTVRDGEMFEGGSIQGEMSRGKCPTLVDPGNHCSAFIRCYLRQTTSSVERISRCMRRVFATLSEVERSHYSYTRVDVITPNVSKWNRNQIRDANTPIAASASVRLPAIDRVTYLVACRYSFWQRYFLLYMWRINSLSRKHQSGFWVQFGAPDDPALGLAAATGI